MFDIGFAGLGLMGQPMVRRLLAAGLSVQVWNRHADKCCALTSAGASPARNLAQLAAESKLLMLCLRDTAAVESVVFGRDGLASHSKSGQLLVDFSSISPRDTQCFAERLKQQSGAHWVDAPVSGGVGGAEKGSLIIMAGGLASDIEQLRPILAHLSQRVSHMGAVGTGQVAKLCNQLIVAANAVLIAEAVALAEESGVDATQLASALAGGFADSLPLQILAPRMAGRQFLPVQWKVATLLKDLDNAIQHGELCHSLTPLAQQAAQRLREHLSHGHADHDLSSLILLYESVKD
ncbi:NAD(P)-dependent oxidoreductase [Neisseriaceae bacterium TC5R-5]|nr:NAD(P)-dependent oxidoreductase [Neisseriaceae bacterium TC5R-5]